ncbi:MAG: hypothetical protein JO304_24400 [Solirubrobacterales bacterium]|nr:hypothetical protein [Solirubrobacterales bacterium]
MTEHSLPIPHAIPRVTADTARKLQITLGAIWLIDGVLQIQPFMFSRSFVTQIIAPNAADQPGLIAAPIRVVAHLIEPRVALFNLLAITIQVLIGVGVMYRPTVKPALLVSFAWALGVWWIGEGLGGLFTGNASPLTGAPGAALLYVLAGLIVWPRARSRTEAAGVGGVLGERGARVSWALLWFGFAALWLLPANRAQATVHDAIANAPSGAHWLAGIQTTAASAAAGHGLAIALVAAGLAAAVGLSALFARCATPALVLAIVIGLVYFVLGQGMGGILTGSGTDPGTGPLIILLAISIYSLRRSAQPLTWRKRHSSQTPQRLSFPVDANSPSPDVRPATR